jgi:hypothetical protein
MLRGWRCSTGCGWHGLRFSNSLFLREKARVRKAVYLAILLVSSVLAVRYALSRAPERSTPSGNEGIQEIE